jgi:site-specific DNA-methyltransferase (adenine-specific)
MENYKLNRKKDFKRIEKALSSVIKAQNTNALVIQGDSLEILKKIPSESVSLVLTDPPYHSTKKKNIKGDTSFNEDEDFLNWMSEYVVEWKRVLKKNGSIFCFCSATMSARLELVFRKEFNVLSNVVWTKPNEPGFDGWKQKMKKESLRQWYEHTERVIFAEPSFTGNMFKSWYGIYLKEARLKAGISGHKLTELTGAYGKVNHGGAVSNWEAGRNVPSKEQYEKICLALIGTGNIKTMPDYEDLIRPFNVNGSIEFTDVWTFPSVRPYKGKHPAEKPLSMLIHAIEATTYEGDVVLDCFAGSGSTQIAALKTNRRAVSIELDSEWAERVAGITLAKIESKTEPKVDKKNISKNNLSQIELLYK